MSKITNDGLINPVWHAMLYVSCTHMWCWRKMLGISWKEHRTNISILEEIGLERELMGKVARMKYSTSDTLPGEVQEPWH